MSIEFDGAMMWVMLVFMTLLTTLMAIAMVLAIAMLFNYVVLNYLLKRVLIQFDVYRGAVTYLMHRKKIDEWLKANTRKGGVAAP